ncbi:MAG: GYDIA family GHMP kinase [Bacteroidales bacterium]
MNTDFELKANGKLLISGEYLVLNGAKSLAFPIRFGQKINVCPVQEPVLHWKSMQNSQTWFTATFNLPDLMILTASDTVVASELIRILKAVLTLNPEFIPDNSGFSVEINADFPLEWGLGSSSTLIYLIARWANVNEFSVFRLVADGSGYDLACAGKQTPVFYQLVDNFPIIANAEFGYAIKNHCLFAYLGNKQNTNEELKSYKNTAIASQLQIDRISELSEEFCNVSDPKELIDVIKEHEQIISTVLKRPALSQQRFPDFKGGVKSLGAWGGDFAMFAADISQDELRKDINRLGLTTLFSYDELLIK